MHFKTHPSIRELEGTVQDGLHLFAFKSLDVGHVTGRAGDRADPQFSVVVRPKRMSEELSQLVLSFMPRVESCPVGRLQHAFRHPSSVWSVAVRRPEAVPDEDQVRRLVGRGHDHSETMSTALCEGVDREVQYRRGHSVESDPTQVSHVGIRREVGLDAWSFDCTRAAVADAEYQHPTAGVGHGGEVFGEIRLGQSRRRRWIELEVEVCPLLEVCSDGRIQQLDGEGLRVPTQPPMQWRKH